MAAPPLSVPPVPLLGAVSGAVRRGIEDRQEPVERLELISDPLGEMYGKPVG